MNPAGRLDTVMELFNKGFLCKCPKRALEEIGDDCLNEVIIHEDNCEGKAKALELLFKGEP